jgi:hypothetical protein
LTNEAFELLPASYDLVKLIGFPLPQRPQDGDEGGGEGDR